MPAVSKTQALELLAQAVREQFGPDELLEIHNEIFPEAPFTEAEAYEDSGPLIEHLVDHINSGLEIEEIIELLELIFLSYHHVWYDEEEEKIHYEEGEAVSSE